MDKITEQTIDVREFFRILNKRKWTVISLLTLSLTFAIIYILTTTPQFQASVRLVIEKDNPNIVSIKEVMAVDTSTSDYYQTEYKIIESRTIAREVIKRLSLADSEEFNSKINESLLSKFKQSIKQTISNALQSIFYSGKEKKDFEFENSDSSLVNAFISRIEVEPVRNSRLVDIRYTSSHPKRAADIVNTLAHVYIDKNLETKLLAAQDAVKWLHDRVDEERKKVEKAELNLLKYKEEQDIITDFSTDVEKITAQKLAQLNAQVIDAEAHRVEAETRYNQAIELKNKPDMIDSIPEVLRNDLIQNIKKMEVEIYNRMSELSKKYGAKHPRMIAIQSEIDNLKNRKGKEINRIINSLRNEYKVALAKENTLKKALNKQKQENIELNKKSIEYSVLRREAENARHLYDLLIKRFKETSLTEEMKTGNIRIVDRAEIPKFPIAPRKKILILIAMFGGIAFGIVLAFFIEYIDNTIKIPDDIREYLNIPYLGPVPSFDLTKSDIPHPELITYYSSKSTASESYRGIRTSILFSTAEKSLKVLLVTSAGPGEGKTLTSTNLAITMAQAGTKVLLIDCDMRKPKIHKMFGLTRDQNGMSSLLVGKASKSDAIIRLEDQPIDKINVPNIPNLDIIICGLIPPNPSEIIGSERMSQLMTELKNDYDRIIIDSPPVTAVTDSTVLAKFVDGVILVVHSGETPRQIVYNGLEKLQAVNANVLGAVLNDVDTGKESYYYYQYYYYYYGEDGHKNKRHKRKKRSSKQYG